MGQTAFSAESILDSTSEGRDLLTSASLADPNADRILIWDDSATGFRYADLGSGLSISGTTLNLDADLSGIAGLADPNADRILFWDDSAGSYQHLSLGAGLSITGTTLNNTLDLSGYVPYTGATTNVNLGSNTLTAGGATINGMASITGGATISGGGVTSTGGLKVGSYSSSVGGLWNYLDTPSITNYLLVGSSSDVFLNAPITAGVLFLRIGGTTKLDLSNTLATWAVSQEIRNSTTAMSHKVFTTYTSTTSHEGIQLKGVASANSELATFVGSAGGTLRGITIGGYAAGASTITGCISVNPTDASTTFLSNAGNARWAATSTYFGGWASDGAVLYAQDPSLTVPNILCRRNDTNTGLGGLTDNPALIAGGVTVLQGTTTVLTVPLQFVNSQGTITASTPHTITQTWNNGSVTFDAFDVVITATSAVAGSRLMRLATTALGNLFTVDNAGLTTTRDITLSGGTGVIKCSAGLFLRAADGNSQINIGNGTSITYQGYSHIFNETSFGESFRIDSGLITFTHPIIGASNILSIRNGTSAQLFSVYNTYTSSTSYERGVFDWTTTTNTLRIGTEKGSGGGTARVLVLVTDGTTRVTIGATSGIVTLTAPVTLKGYTVATLPAGVQGHKAFVTDALAPAYSTAVVGGGAVVTEVFYDGTNWVCS